MMVIILIYLNFWRKYTVVTISTCLGLFFPCKLLNDNEVTNLDDKETYKEVKWPDFKYEERSVIYKNVVADLLKTVDLR